MIGPKQVGKSTLANALLGGNFRSLTTEKIQTSIGHFLGAGQCIAVTDTPGPSQGVLTARKAKSIEGTDLYKVSKSLCHT